MTRLWALCYLSISVTNLHPRLVTGKNGSDARRGRVKRKQKVMHMTMIKGKNKKHNISIKRMPSIPSFSDMYVFGDSLSDIGNLRDINPVVPERFSNGPLAVEYMADFYGLQQERSGYLVSRDNPGNNYAVSASRSTPLDFPSNFETDLPQTRLPAQVKAFLQNVQGDAPSDALYVVMTGSNDVFDMATLRFLDQKNDENSLSYLQSSATSIAQSVDALLSSGAKYILVADTFDVGGIPFTTLSSGDYAAIATEFSVAMNTFLEEELRTIECNTGIDIMHFQDTFRFEQVGFNEGLQVDIPCTIGPSGIPYANPVIPPFNGNPSNPVLGICNMTAAEGYFFWDAIHPTTMGHKILATLAIDFINQEFNKRISPTTRKKRCKVTSKKITKETV